MQVLSLKNAACAGSDPGTWIVYRCGIETDFTHVTLSIFLESFITRILGTEFSVVVCDEARSLTPEVFIRLIRFKTAYEISRVKSPGQIDCVYLLFQNRKMETFPTVSDGFEAIYSDISANEDNAFRNHIR